MHPDSIKQMVDLILGLYAMVVQNRHATWARRLYKIIQEDFALVFPKKLFDDLPEQLAHMIEVDVEDDWTSTVTSTPTRNSVHPINSTKR